MSKVRLESFLWGAGTALGELPPYFMARAARLSGYDPDDAEDLQQFEELQKKRALGEKLNLFEKLKLGMERIVERIGFLGILACASVSSRNSHVFHLPNTTFFHFAMIFRFLIRSLISLASPAVISWCPSGHSSVQRSSGRL